MKPATNLQNVEAQLIKKILEKLNHAILGREQETMLTLACLFARGHLLIEDLPGLGKTTLVKSIANVLGLEMSRIQFTNDLLPSDIIGTSIYNQDHHSFEFKKGPIFSQIVLGDELNRATPKSQSAFLQAMEENHITVDNQTYALPQPFILIATQNPIQQIGTYPLPESQLDRFMMCLHMGFPSAEAEKKIIIEGEISRADLIQSPLLTTQQFLNIQSDVEKVVLSDPIVSYIQQLSHQSRYASELSKGVSPRGSLMLSRAAKAWAYINQRSFCLPEDVQQVIKPVFRHRLGFDHKTDIDNFIEHEIIRKVPAP